MKKKLMLYILTLFVMIIGVNGVSAKNQIGYCKYSFDGKEKQIEVYSDKTFKFDGITYTGDMWKTAADEMYDKGSCYLYIFSSNSTLEFKNEFVKPDGASTYMLFEKDINSLSCYYDIKAFNDEANPKYVRLKIKRNGNASRIFLYYMNNKKEYVELDLDGNLWTIPSIYGKEGDDSVVTYYVDETPVNTTFKIDSILDLYENISTSTTCPKLSYDKWSDGTSTMVTVYPKTNYSSDLENAYAAGGCKYSYKDGTTSEGNVNDAGRPNDNEKTLCDKNGSIQYNDKTVKFNFRIKTENDKVKWGVQINGGYKEYDLSIKQSLALPDDDLNGHSMIKFQPDDELWDYLKGIQDGTKTTCPSYIGAYYSNGDFSDSIATGDMSSGTFLLTMDKEKATFDLNDGRTTDPGGSRHQTAVKKALEKDNPGTDVSGCAGLIGPNTLAFLNAVLNVIMIAGPIIGVLLGTYELITAMAAGDDDAKKKGIKRLQNRLIASALLLLVPYIVKFILNIAGRSTSADCIDAMQNLIIIRSNLF